MYCCNPSHSIASHLVDLPISLHFLACVWRWNRFWNSFLCWAAAWGGLKYCAGCVFASVCLLVCVRRFSLLSELVIKPRAHSLRLSVHASIVLAISNTQNANKGSKQTRGRRVPVHTCTHMRFYLFAGANSSCVAEPTHTYQTVDFWALICCKNAVFFFANYILELVGSLQIRTYKNSDESAPWGENNVYLLTLGRTKTFFPCMKSILLIFFVPPYWVVLSILLVGGKEPCFVTFCIISSDENILYISVAKWSTKGLSIFIKICAKDMLSLGPFK